MRIGGIDGCPAGWLRLQRDESTPHVSAAVFGTADELFKDAECFAVLTIDIPIGLPDSGPRDCDLKARAFIQPRGSSVFPAPVRATLGATEYREACKRSEAASGKSLSRQAFAILPKIREVDAFLRSTTVDVRLRIREVHPEVCFRAWNGAPMMDSKKSGLGFTTRLALVESRYPGQFTSTRRAIERRAATDDDILDAFAALWTAERIVGGSAICLSGDNPPIDGAGLRMEILA